MTFRIGKAGLVLILAVMTLPFLTVRPAHATDYGVSPIVTTASGGFVSASETKLSVDPSASNGYVVYGANTPLIYTSLMAGNAPSPLDQLRITVTITGSSGLVVDPQRVNGWMYDSPHDTGIDYLSELSDLYNSLAQLAGWPSLPNTLTNALPTGSISSNTSSVSAQWSDPLTLSAQNKHSVVFKYQPNFPTPDAYSIRINTYARARLCCPDGSVTYYIVTSSYDIQYVYESDASSGTDAGNTFSTALGIPPGSSTGLLYGADTVDMYRFDVSAGNRLYFSVTPPSSASFNLGIYDQNHQPLQSSANGRGGTDCVSFLPSITGTFFANVTALSGSGAYSFSLSSIPCIYLTASPNSLPAVGGARSGIYVNAVDGQSDVQVSLSTTLGDLSTPSCTTLGAGICSVFLSSRSPGNAVVTATAPGYSSAQTTVTFSLAPDFSIALSCTYPPDSTFSCYAIPSGAQSQMTVTLTSLNSFSGTVNLATSADPPSGPITLNPTSLSLSPGGQATSSLVFPSSSFGCGYGQCSSETVTVTGVCTSGTCTSPVQTESASAGIDIVAGGGGGSIAHGSLITLADNSRTAVQNLLVGDKMLGYDTATGQFTASTVVSLKTVSTDDMLIIHTQSGIPFRVDANPHQTLWTRKAGGGSARWIPVTEIVQADSLLTPAGWVHVTSIEFAPAGTHVMYDITATAPYFADGYLDPVEKQ